MRHLIISLVLIASSLITIAQDGPFAPAAGEFGSTAIHKDSCIITSWAMNGSAILGFMDINNPDLGYPTFGSENDIIGYPDNLVLSLGDSGHATYTFEASVFDGIGPDFAIFENSFSDDFLEFAHVEVSSDGTNFYRFPSTCLIQNDIQVDGFGTSDPTKIHNLAGKYRMNYGTPFDLSDLSMFDELDITNIIAIKIIDVIGNISEPNTSVDSNDNIINDPYPTPFPSSGFDLDAVGLIHVVTSIPTSEIELTKAHPNPTEGTITISINGHSDYHISLFNTFGANILNKKSVGEITSIDLSAFPDGIYICKIDLTNTSSMIKIIKH